MSIINLVEKDLNKVEAYAKSQLLIGFVTNDGKKHLGFYSPIVNPCGDYNNPDDYQERYTDVYGTKYSKVKGKCEICEVDCFYWDEFKNEYIPMPAYLPPQEMTNEERTSKSVSGLFRKDLITSSPLLQMASMIREWLFLNAHCSAPVYIDKGGKIHSEGEIVINNDALQSIPDYIDII